jgi:hypothetical protein
MVSFVCLCKWPRPSYVNGYACVFVCVCVCACVWQREAISPGMSCVSNAFLWHIAHTVRSGVSVSVCVCVCVCVCACVCVCPLDANIVI